MKTLLRFAIIAGIFSFSMGTITAQIRYLDSITFEIPNTFITIDTNGGNLWQIGSPHKTFFNMAHHGTHALLTDTVNYYPPNDTSSFILKLHYGYVSNCLTSLSFWHKYDMDTVGDKGIIEASYDGGNSWLILKDTMGQSPFWGPYMFFWQPDLDENLQHDTPHKLITNGKSNGWIQSGFVWYWWVLAKKDTIIINPASLMIRFTFISDSIVKNKEGWMIDDISIYFSTYCSSIEEHTDEGLVSVYPNPFTNQLTLTCNNPPADAELEVFDVIGQKLWSRHVSQREMQSPYTIDLSNTPCHAGIYFVKLGNSVVKVVKE